MKKLSALFISVLAIPSIEAATISFVPGATNVAPGGSFTVQVYGSSINDIAGYSLYLNSTAGANLFQITSQALNTTLFTYGGPSPSFPEFISTTQTSQDLGAFSLNDLPENTSYLLGTETISVSASTPGGSYQIGNTSQTVFADPSFTQSDFAPASHFTISVVPEPSIVSLLLMSIALTACGRRRISSRDRL